MQTSYPIFESGQVLTSRHLNDVVNYLEQHDRLTRSKLIGVGIVCGLDVELADDQQSIKVSAGCAVTSEGYLIISEPLIADRAREYRVPVPMEEDDGDPDEVSDERYPWFFSGEQSAGDQQIQLWELLATTYQPHPGEAAPLDVTADFVRDKVALVFLEGDRRPLRNCDINDCSDKGAEMELTPRVLLVGIADAEAMLAREAEIAGRPVDRNRHPRYDLSPLRVLKIHPAARHIDSFPDLYGRIVDIGGPMLKDLHAGLQAGYQAYRYLLSDVYPTEQFPNGPLANATYFDNVLANVGANVLLIQYFHDYLRDAAASHNEFLDAAGRFEAECCPSEARFPRHVLLGLVSQRPTAFAPPASPPNGRPADPFAADSGFGANTRTAALRHHFIPAMTHAGHAERLAELRSLHYRTYLLAYRYSTQDLVTGPLRLTPSKDGNVTLSETAVPFYYALRAGDDLHRNWSFPDAVRNRLDRVLSHTFIDDADHPLSYRMDDHNFIRVEGLVGKPLGLVMRHLIEEKRRLGVSFGIEPVYLGIHVGNDKESGELDRQSRASAERVLKSLLFCRLRELDVTFLTVLSSLFYYLYTVISQLAAGNTRLVAGARLVTPIDVPDATETISDRRRIAQAELRGIRSSTYIKGELTARVTTGNEPANSIGKLYEQVKGGPADNLFDRLVQTVRQIIPEGDPRQFAHRAYPTVSLLDKAEQLVESVGTPSIGQFDLDGFEHKYASFISAFDEFKRQADSDDEGQDSDLSRFRRAVLASYSAVASTTSQSVIGNLLSEFQIRLDNLFNQLTMTSYAPRHPGMQHKAGVPAGGTLVLLYTSADLLRRVLDVHQEFLDSRFRALRASLTREGSSAPSVQALSAATNSNDALDRFVVVADFCLPYFCCDTDCSDIELQPIVQEGDSPGRPPIPRPPDPERPEPEPLELIVIRGTVLGSPGEPGAAMRPLPSAKLHIAHVETGEEIDVRIEDGVFEFKLMPGTYRVQASASRTFVPLDKTMRFDHQTPRELDLVLDRV